MEDDDEFGDLYTDVLRPLTTSSASGLPPPVQSTSTASDRRPIDLNANSDDDKFLYGAPNSRTPNLSTSSSYQKNQTLVLEPEKLTSDSIVAKSSDYVRISNELNKDEGLAEIGKNLDARVLLKSGDVGVAKRAFEDPNFMDESAIDVVVEERDDKDDVLVEKDENLADRSEYIGNLMGRSNNFDAEEAGELGSEPLIPGLSIPGVSGPAGNREDANLEADWDSDSDDDLQIVLNDNNHGPMAMDRGGLMGGEEDDDEDEDGEPLVIVADSDNPNRQPMAEEKDWGEDAAQGVDGERKDLNDAAKANGGVAVTPKIGYSTHGFHPFHSQFKYVRPGAAPMPGAASVGPGGAPGQVRPPVNTGPMVGRGRGDWRPTGMKNAPAMQKGFHLGYGMPVWGSNASGRGFSSGLEFTLPSHKTIFEVDIDSFEEKPWRLQGIDISDYFNFGLNEESWKDYCRQLEQLRLETTMQSKIRVVESGRTEQEYDPDMPPELAAAAGIHDFSSENANLGKVDAGQSDLAKSARLRPPLPTGRAIQVESGSGDRLPSIDTRPPRIRDSDAIIEIVLQDSADDDPYTGNNMAKKPDNGPSREVLGGGNEFDGDIVQEDTDHVDGFSHACNGRKREFAERRPSFINSADDNVTNGDGTLPFPSEAPLQYSPDSGGQTPAYSGRNLGIPPEEGGTRDKAPDKTPSEGMQDKRFHDKQKEESVESADGKQDPYLPSVAAREQAVECEDATHDELVLADGSSEVEKDFNETSQVGILKDESLKHSLKKQKLSSRVEQPSLQDADDGEDSKAAKSSENSKARSESSKDYRRLSDGADDEVVQGGRFMRVGNRRPLSEDEDSVRKKDRDERKEMERHHMAVKVGEDSYSRKSWDSNLAPHSRVKVDGIARRNNSDISDGVRPRREEDAHSRRARVEDARKRERSDEMGSRQQSKLRENERIDKDDVHKLRKQLDNGSWRGHHDKDIGSRHREKEDNLKNQNDNMDDLRSKRRKEEAKSRRDRAEKEEIFPVNRESTSRRKREKDDALDQRKRDVQPRIRDDDLHSIRHKEEGWHQRVQGERHRERDDWFRLKQSHEENLSNRDREEGRGGGRSGRVPEDKAWMSHSRMKPEYKVSDRDHHLKDEGRHAEQFKKRDRVDNTSPSKHRGREDVYVRGNQIDINERRAKHEKASSRTDRSLNAFDRDRVNERKPKENPKKGKESEGGDHNSSISSRRNQEDRYGQMTLNCKIDQVSDELKVPANLESSRKHKEDGSSEDEQHDGKRGRSKLERWTSHKERDFNVSTKSSSSLKIKEIDIYNDMESSLDRKVPDEPEKTIETADNQHPLANEKATGEPYFKKVDAKPMEERHLETVAKLKKRSERFKLPMPSEKETVAIKKMESEPLPSVDSETRTDAEIKPERPARKRRWTSNS